MKSSRIMLVLLVVFVLGGLLLTVAGLSWRLYDSIVQRQRSREEREKKIERKISQETPSKKPADAAPGESASADPSKKETPADKNETAAQVPDGYVDAKVGAIRISEDAVNKKGGFWLEQPFSMETEKAQDGQPILKLYAGLDGDSMRGIAVNLSGGKLALEFCEGKDKSRDLARAKLPKLAPGQYDLGVMWRGGELSVWIGPLEALAWKPSPDDKAEAMKLLALDSAFQALTPGLKIGARRAIAFDAIRFDDNFMRQASNGNGEWKPICGNWELTTMTFAERSANPFSLRASFKGMPPFEEDPLNAADKRVRDGDYGIGVQLSFSEGTPHIVRLTGGGPAGHAGLAEDDIFIKVNGRDVSRIPSYMLFRELNGAAGDITLTMYRPGEKTLREVVVKPQGYKWGVSQEGVALQPTRDTNSRPSGDYSFIAAGEEGWSDYEAEVAVKPLGAGGMGLAVGVTTENDYLLFRWLGPHERNESAREKENVLQLVHVKEGAENVLAEKQARYRPYEFYRMGVNWRDGKIVGLIDKNEILSAEVKSVKRGKIGLWALKGNAVFFDDVHVAGDRSVTANWRSAERSLNSIFALEDDMEVWANPALEWDRNLKTGWAIHNQRFPGDQGLSINKPRFNELNIALYCGSDPENAACPRLTIKNGVAELRGEGFEPQSVNVGAGPFQRIGFDCGAYGVRAAIDGKKMSTSWAGTKPHLAGAMAMGGGERIAIRGLKNLGDPGALRVTSTGTLEYTFDNAPVDWKVQSGRWGQLNKWICDPRWSWFGGRTKTVGAVWNKHVFSGDVSVDAHVATMMMRDDPPFERPGDFNLAVCGDGENLDSGYTLICGGDLNSWTRLYRKGVLVAETSEERFRIFSDRIRHPDKPDLHQRWFHLKLEKLGSTVYFYRDGELAFKFVDPEPLKEGQAAFWTFDNGFLISRLRIAHGGARPAPFESGRCELFEDKNVINMFDGEYLTGVSREALPAEIANALNSAEYSLVSAPPSTAKVVGEDAPFAYHVANGIGGGPFALQFKSRSVKMSENSVVRFAYRIEPGAKVDLYVNVLGPGDFDPRHLGCYRWRLSGPAQDNSGALCDEFSPLVGEIPGVVADGNWHLVQFNLRPSWNEFWKRRGVAPRDLPLNRVMFGNLDNSGYLLAGMNGNHAGAVYAVSDVRMLPGATNDKTPPRAVRVIWPFDAEGDGHSVKLVFDDAGGSGVDPNTLTVRIKRGDEKDLGFRVTPFVFNDVTQTLTIDPSKQFQTTDGTVLKLILAPGFKDRAGNADALGFTAEWIYHAEQIKAANKPVYAPVIYAKSGGETAPSLGSAPLSTREITAEMLQAVRVQESNDAPPWAPAGQRHSVETIGTGELTSMGFHLPGVTYSTQRWPYLELEYKVPIDTPFNLLMRDDGDSVHSLLLVDLEDKRDHLSQEINTRFGPPKDFVADNTWRRSTVPLAQLFASANPGVEPLRVTGFSFEDRGWKGGRRGLHWWLHRIQPVPAGRLEDLSFSWTSDDLVGIADFESSIDTDPNGEPHGTKELLSGASLKTVRKALADGWNYLHVRVKNSAGVWSQTAHRKFYLDTTPPRVVKTEPSNGGVCAGQTIKIYLDEPHRPTMVGATFKIDGDNMAAFTEFDPVENVLKYNAISAGRPFAPGATVSVELNGVSDAFGNTQVKPYAFTFKYTGKSGPGPEMKCVHYAPPTEQPQTYRQYDMELSFGLNFEEYIGHVHAIRDCRMDWVNDLKLACDGNRALCFTSLQDDGDPQIMLHKNAWYIDKLPLLNFDYRAEPGFNVDLQLEAYGEWHSIKFLGSGHAPSGGKALGALAGIVADGKWRHASVDLRALIDAAGVKMPSRIINKIVLSANGEDGCKRGATLWIDNLDFASAGGTGPRGGYGALKYKAQENSAGIDGYSYAVDQNPDTIPPEMVKDRTGEVGLQFRRGVWYAHVRACDQAGNWGPTQTIRIDFGETNRSQPMRGLFDEN